MSINSRLKAIHIIGQRKAFCWQRIPESSCARKETADIEILITSRRKGDRKMMQPIRITSEWNCYKYEEKEPVQPVQMDIYQSSSYRKDLNWLHFDDEGFKRLNKRRTNTHKTTNICGKKKIFTASPQW